MPRTLAFFGAFNPPSRAHIDLADCARQQIGARDVIFVPSKSSYITGFQGKGFAFSDEDRIAMLKQIADNRPWMRWTDIEMKQPDQPHTYDTLCMLRDLGEEPSLLIGADKLLELDYLWAKVREISDEFGIVCMDRSDIDCEAVIRRNEFLSSLNLTVVHVPEDYKAFSSTRIRASLEELYTLQSTLQELLPPELAELPADLMRKQVR